MMAQTALLHRTLIVSTFLFTSACSSIGWELGSNKLNDYELGSALEQMRANQTYNQSAASKPPEGILAGMDGELGEKVLNAYRGAGETTDVKSNIELDVGSD